MVGKTESKLREDIREGLVSESERGHRAIHLLEEKLAREVSGE